MKLEKKINKKIAKILSSDELTKIMQDELTEVIRKHKAKKKAKITEIIPKEVIEQIKETDRAINELDKSMDRLKEKLFEDNICEHKAEKKAKKKRSYCFEPLGPIISSPSYTLKINYDDNFDCRCHHTELIRINTFRDTKDSKTELFTFYYKCKECDLIMQR